MIHLDLLGGNLQGLLVQLELLVGDEELLIVQLFRFGFQHGEVLVQADGEDQHEHQQQGGHHVGVADPAGARVAAAPACAAVMDALACHGHTSLEAMIWLSWVVRR